MPYGKCHKKKKRNKVSKLQRAHHPRLTILLSGIMVSSCQEYCKTDNRGRDPWQQRQGPRDRNSRNIHTHTHTPTTTIGPNGNNKQGWVGGQTAKQDRTDITRGTVRDVLTVCECVRGRVNLWTAFPSGRRKMVRRQLWPLRFLSEICGVMVFVHPCHIACVQTL